MYYYLLTIKINNKKFYDYKLLSEVHREITNDTDYMGNYCFENDSHVKLHLHAIIGNTKKLYFKKYKKKGYHIHFQTFPHNDLPKVRAYLKKEEHPLLTNYYYHNHSCN